MRDTISGDHIRVRKVNDRLIVAVEIGRTDIKNKNVVIEKLVSFEVNCYWIGVCVIVAGDFSVFLDDW